MTQDKTNKKISVAFICLGNFCRSPMSEAVFAHTVKRQGLMDRFSKIDSFGTASYHVGETPDSRSVATCKKNGVPVNHVAQKIRGKDFDEFDYIICMDQSNYRDLEKVKPKNATKGAIYLFGHWNTDDKFDKIVEDPYYGGVDGFEYNFEQITYFSEEFLKREL